MPAARTKAAKVTQSELLPEIAGIIAPGSSAGTESDHNSDVGSAAGSANADSAA